MKVVEPLLEKVKSPTLGPAVTASLKDTFHSGVVDEAWGPAIGFTYANDATGPALSALELVNNAPS